MKRVDAGTIRHAIEQARKPANPELYEALRNGLTRRSWRLWVRAHNRITMRGTHRMTVVDGEIEVCTICRNSAGNPIAWDQAHPPGKYHQITPLRY